MTKLKPEVEAAAVVILDEYDGYRFDKPCLCDETDYFGCRHVWAKDKAITAARRAVKAIDKIRHAPAPSQSDAKVDDEN